MATEKTSTRRVGPAEGETRLAPDAERALDQLQREAAAAASAHPDPERLWQSIAGRMAAESPHTGSPFTADDFPRDEYDGVPRDRNGSRRGEREGDGARAPGRSGSASSRSRDDRSHGDGSRTSRRSGGRTSSRSRARSRERWALLSLVAVCVIGLGATVWLARRTERSADTQVAQEAEKTGGIRRVFQTAVPEGDGWPFALLEPGYIAKAEGRDADKRYPYAVGGYRRMLRNGSNLTTTAGTALTLRSDTVTAVELRDQTTVHVEHVSTLQRRLRVVSGTLVVRTETRAVEPSITSAATPDVVAQSRGTLYAVSFDPTTNISFVSVVHGSVSVMDRNGSGLSTVVPAGRRLRYHPEDRAFHTELLPAAAEAALFEARKVPELDEAALQQGVTSLGDDAEAAGRLETLRAGRAGNTKPPVPPSKPAPLPAVTTVVAEPPAPPAPVAGAASAHSSDAAGPPRGDPYTGLKGLDEAARERVEQLYALVEGLIRDGRAAEADTRLTPYLQTAGGPEQERGYFLRAEARRLAERSDAAKQAYIDYLNRFPSGYWAPQAQQRLVELGRAGPRRGAE